MALTLYHLPFSSASGALLTAGKLTCSGAKGVLAHWPDRVGQNEVRLRPSLIKFESSLTDLNVVRVRMALLYLAHHKLAKYQVAFLNRQFINIMCANGVSQHLMIELFEEAVSNIKGLRVRVQQGAVTKDDWRLMSSCSDVR